MFFSIFFKCILKSLCVYVCPFKLSSFGLSTRWCCRNPSLSRTWSLLWVHLYYCKDIYEHFWAERDSFGKFCLLCFLGQWIFQLLDVDFRERPNRLGFEVHHWRRPVWTGLFNELSSWQQSMIRKFSGQSIWIYNFYLLRHTSTNWSWVVRRSSSPMKTRRNTSSE